jgi:hypothetical protein
MIMLLAFLALFKGVDLFYGFGICSIAANAPDGIGRIEDNAAILQYFKRLFTSSLSMVYYFIVHIH